MKTFDMIIASDLRFTGGTSSAIAHETGTLNRLGLRLGLLHVPSSFMSSTLPLNDRVIAAAKRCDVPIIAGGEAVEAKVLIAAHPNVFRRVDRHRFGVRARLTVIMAQNIPADHRGRLMFDPWAVQAACRRAFGARVVWAPISPLCRDRFDRVGRDLDLLRFDWINYIRIEEWSRPIRSPAPDQMRIGRHSRPDREKFPDTAEEMLQAYPAGPEFDVAFLGYHEPLDRLLGQRPANWRCLPFGSQSARDFLAAVDFFVYFHASTYTETFGRVVAEAIASGAVAILPPYLERSFGPAAIYARPPEVKDVLRAIHADPDRYRAHAQSARDWLAEHYDEPVYVANCRSLLDAVDRDAVDDLVVRPAPIGPAQAALLRGEYYARKAAEMVARRPL